MVSKPLESALVCLHEFWPDFQLTNDNLMNPTSDIAVKFYERFICGQLQIEIGNIEQMLLEKCSCKDAFADILNIYTLYLCTATVIRQLGLKELSQTFGFTDLLSPKRKKFKMSLILLSNCVVYVSGLQECMEELKNKVFQDLHRFENNQREIDELKERINNAVVSHMKNKQKKDDLRKRKDHLFKEIRSAQEELERTKEKLKVDELELNQIQDEYEVLDAKTNDLLKVEEQLKSEIVYDHENIANKIDRQVKEKDALLAESDEYDVIMNQKMQTISCYQENLNCINHFLETVPLSELLKKYEVLHEYNSEIKQYENEIKAFNETETLDQVALNQLQNAIGFLERDIQQLIIKHENEMKIYEKEIEESQIEIKIEHDKRGKIIETSDRLDEEIQEINNSSKQYEAYIEKQNGYYFDKYREILELKMQLENKVMGIINTVNHELTYKEKK